ncbi:MAG TPA: hypothetical protein VK530_10145 [Candidatus Acidoferrum sp.]|nr:hypothetical protein [Candidatus Acidoferrum sp.]
MGKNRKNGSAARFVPAVKAALLCLLLGGSAIGYVYQKNQLAELGKQIDRREKQHRALRDYNTQLERTMATLKLPNSLMERVNALRLGLAAPVQSQILTIVEMPATAGSGVQPLVMERPENGVAALK